MMNIDDTTLMKYVDGELDDAQARELERHIESDEILAERLNKLLSVNQKLAQVFANIDQQPLPSNVVDLVTPETSNVLPIRKQKRNARKSWYVPLSMAASVLLVVFTYNLMVDTNVLQSSNDDTYSILNTQPSTTTKGNINILASYTNAGGEFCRHYLIQQDTSQSQAIACRNANGRWKQVIEIDSIPQSAYIPAGAESDTEMQRLLSGMDKLTPVTEQAFLQSK
ncbi:MAG: hypothetical protein KJO69_00610 [Gammaproteobacteria bacterium]|nr:hypothetical protein [Gammaproteobacteria bacterium]